MKLGRILSATIFVLALVALPTGVGGAATGYDLGYIGCSNTKLAVSGYHALSADDRLWPAYATTGMSIERWADPLNPVWERYDAQVATHGQPAEVWVQVCINSDRPAGIEEIRAAVTNLSSHSPTATVHLSPINTFDPPDICPLTADVASVAALVDQAVAEGWGQRGPDLGPLGVDYLQDDHCHPNQSGRGFLGAQVKAAFDEPPPITTITDGPSDPTAETTATFAFSADEEAVTFSCSLDGGAAEACSSPVTYAGLAETGHAFSVSATDTAGNTGNTATWTWTIIDVTPPTTTITSGPSDPTTETSSTFTFSADEDPASFSCSLDGSALEACSSPVTYTGLSPGPHAFSVAATDGSGNVGNAATWSWTISDVVSVSVQDFSFSPKSPIGSRGGAVQWTFNGPSEHTATDRSGMALFDSGPTGPGGSYTVSFVGAGKYIYGCTFHPEMAGSIRVPIDASPPTGSISTSFFVTWAAEDAPAGFVYDVQIRRPGASRWVSWMNGATTPGTSFVPDAGTGSYGFRGRLRSVTSGAASKYSTADYISVT
ncbi:MAG: hypothetical protein H0W27_07355 [Actinobacteria bacterium]|nr:hypothetical protein [Actinomycetota bacterium]